MNLSFSGTRTPQLTQKILFYQLHYSKACYEADLMVMIFRLLAAEQKSYFGHLPKIVLTGGEL